MKCNIYHICFLDQYASFYGYFYVTPAVKNLTFNTFVATVFVISANLLSVCYHTFFYCQTWGQSGRTYILRCVHLLIYPCDIQK